jgi:hypothetical protein
MQYLVSVIDDNDRVAALGRGSYTATAAEETAVDEINARFQAEGHWVFAGGLAAPSAATVIDNRGSEPVFTDGPFAETKEFLAGFWILEAADLDEALKLGVAASKACNRKIEVRPLLAPPEAGDAAG